MNMLFDTISAKFSSEMDMIAKNFSICGRRS